MIFLCKIKIYSMMVNEKGKKCFKKEKSVSKWSHAHYSRKVYSLIFLKNSSFLSYESVLRIIGGSALLCLFNGLPHGNGV